MFIFNADNMLNELEANYSGYNVLKELPSIQDSNYNTKLSELYSNCEAISIDYAVMEKSQNIYVIPGDFGWDDIGTWNSLERYITKDDNENILNGKVQAYNSRNNIVYAGGKEVILLNADNIFCIETDDVLVIGDRNTINKVHELRNIV